MKSPKRSSYWRRYRKLRKLVREYFKAVHEYEAQIGAYSTGQKRELKKVRPSWDVYSELKSELGKL